MELICNEHKLSRNRKRRNDPRLKNDNNRKLLLKKTNLKKNKDKNLDTIKQLEILLVKIKYYINPDKLQSALTE